MRFAGLSHPDRSSDDAAVVAGSLSMKDSFRRGHPFRGMVPTDTPDNLYYADLFRINDRHWMILGFGKTRAARIASEREDEAMIATDSVAVVRKGDVLWGRYDPGAYRPDSPELSTLHRLDVIAYCLNQEETRKAFKRREETLEIVEVGAEFISGLCANYPYPGVMVPHFFSPQEALHFADPDRMMKQFTELTRGCRGTRFLLVPYVLTVEDKADLYKNYVFS